MSRVAVAQKRLTTKKEAKMRWQTPKIVEIACGCEINAYFPADL